MIGITNEKGLLGSTLDRTQITSSAMLNDEGGGDLSSRPAFQEMMATGKSILTDTASIPIIAMTADASSDAKIRAEEVGMSGYMTKPIDPAQLNKSLETWLKPGRF